MEKQQQQKSIMSLEAATDCLGALNQEVDGLKATVANLKKDVAATKEAATAAQDLTKKAEAAATSAKALAAKPADGLKETLERIDALETKIEQLDELNKWAETAEANISALQETTGCYGPQEKLTIRIRRRIANWFSPDKPQPDKQPAKAKRCRRTK